MPADAYLLDTSIASIAFDVGHLAHSETHKRLSALGDASISICSVSLGEVEYGLEVSPSIDPARHRAVRKNLLQYHVLNIDRHTGKVYGQLRGELFRRYATRDTRGRLKEKRPEDLLDRSSSRELGIQENDLWIVGIAVQYNLRFVTRDRMDRILTAAKDIHGYDRALIWSP